MKALTLNLYSFLLGGLFSISTLVFPQPGLAQELKKDLKSKKELRREALALKKEQIAEEKKQKRNERTILKNAEFCQEALNVASQKFGDSVVNCDEGYVFLMVSNFDDQKSKNVTAIKLTPNPNVSLQSPQAFLVSEANATGLKNMTLDQGGVIFPTDWKCATRRLPNFATILHEMELPGLCSSTDPSRDVSKKSPIELKEVPSTTDNQILRDKLADLIYYSEVGKPSFLPENASFSLHLNSKNQRELVIRIISDQIIIQNKYNYEEKKFETTGFIDKSGQRIGLNDPTVKTLISKAEDPKSDLSNFSRLLITSHSEPSVLQNGLQKIYNDGSALNPSKGKVAEYNILDVLEEYKRLNMPDAKHKDYQGFLNCLAPPTLTQSPLE
jgi:hypothetical protein